MDSKPLRLLVSLSAILLAIALACPALADANPDEGLPGPFHRIRVVDFPGEIGSFIAAYVTRHVKAAERDGIDCLVLRIDSPGGTVLHSQEIGDLLLALPESLHVVAWIPLEAYSGAAMVALACDEIVMGPDAHFGDAQPIIMGPEGITPVGEKMESPLRARFRSYAQKNGYEVALAEAMVSQRIEVIRVEDPSGTLHFVKGEDFRAYDEDDEVVPGILRKDLRQVGPPIVRKEELLTLTAAEAQRYRFLRRTFDGGRSFPLSEDEFLAHLSAPDATVEKYELTAFEKASRWLLGIAGILGALFLLSVIYVLWQGFSPVVLAIGLTLLGLNVLINLTADQLNGFPLFLILLGIALMAVEVFLLPGFGFAGMLGVASMGAGFLFLAGGASFDGFGETGDIAVGFGLQFVVTILAGLGLLILASRFLPSVGPAKRLMLAAPDKRVPEAVTDSDPGVSAGSRGTAASDLRPSGSAEFDGRLVDVVTEGAFVARGRPVVVVEVEGNRVAVRPLDLPDPTDADEESV